MKKSKSKKKENFAKHNRPKQKSIAAQIAELDILIMQMNKIGWKSMKERRYCIDRLAYLKSLVKEKNQ